EATGTARTIDGVAVAAARLSERRWGALMVLEKETGLNEFVQTGVTIDGLVGAEFLLSLFYPNSPLHDGAGIIRGDRVIAAGAGPCRGPREAAWATRGGPAIEPRWGSPSRPTRWWWSSRRRPARSRSPTTGGWCATSTRVSCARCWASSTDRPAPKPGAAPST